MSGKQHLEHVISVRAATITANIGTLCSFCALTINRESFESSQGAIRFLIE
jgi:hypothetical protein